MTNANYIQLSNMHNFGIGAPFRPIHLPIPSFVICTHVTEYFSIRYLYLFENIFDTMIPSFNNSWLHCLVYVGYVVKRLNTNCKLEHNMSCEIGWKIYHGKIEVVSFVTRYGRKLAIGAIFEVKSQELLQRKLFLWFPVSQILWGTLMECSCQSLYY